jgi:serine/threonine protein kinase
MGEGVVGKRTFILKAFDTYTNKDVILKVFDEEESARKEHANLLAFQSNYVVSVFGDVVEFEFEGQRMFGVALEKGEVDVHSFIEQHPRLEMFKRQAIGLSIIQITDFMHSEAGMVWHDLKPSNFIRCNERGDYVVKAIDVEHAVRVGELLPPHHGHTVRFAAPEVIRGGEELVSERSMDMWSLGVTLLFVAKGKDLADLMFPGDTGDAGTNRLNNLYLNSSDADLQVRVDTVLESNFTESQRPLRSLIGHLLQVNVSGRFTIAQVQSHSFVAGGRGTKTMREVDIASNVRHVVEGLEEIKENQEDQMMEIQFMREENEG